MNNFRSDYETYFVEYYGDIKSELNKLDYAFLYEELPIYYVVLIAEGRLKDFLKEIPEIISIQQNYVYVLSQMEESNYRVHDKSISLTTKFTGKGVALGIIGPGIDYLDKEFVHEDGRSRVKAIWDQTIEWNNEAETDYGRKYSKRDVEEAIKLHRGGDNPYKTVEHMDNGYGTNICKVIGGSKFNSVNQCEFAVVKLKRTEVLTRNMNCIKFRNGNLYETYDIVKALQYLSELNKTIEDPMVVYLPVESNSGGRNGSSVLERYINYFSNINNNFFVVTNNGNEGDGYRHSDGIINNEEEIYVPIVVGVEVNERNDERRYDFQVSLWTSLYDRINFKIISPLGERTDEIDTFNSLQVQNFEFHGGTIEILFLPPALKSSEKEVIIKIKNAVQGTWLINLQGKEVTYGDYDIWLPMKELTNYNVNFRYPCRFRTITTPATAAKALTSVCYSQYEKNIRVISGKPCEDLKRRTQESLIVDSTGVLIEDEYGILKIDGVAVSGGILCWMVIIILQWALVEGGKSSIDLIDIKTLLLKASTRHLSNCYSIVDIAKLNDLLVEL